MALHLQALCLVPSWLYLLWRDRRIGPLLRRPVVFGPLAIGGCVIILCSYLLFYIDHHLPLWQAGEKGRVAVFSLPHLLNLSNEI